MLGNQPNCSASPNERRRRCALALHRYVFIFCTFALSSCVTPTERFSLEVGAKQNQKADDSAPVAGAKRSEGVGDAGSGGDADSSSQYDIKQSSDGKTEHNVGCNPLSADVSGSEADAAAPSKILIALAEGFEVPPQTTLHPSVVLEDGSPAPLAVQWSVTGPPGIKAKFLPSSTDAAPSLTLNGAGAWQVCATPTLWLPMGLSLPKKTCAEVAVVPEDATHIELTWHTPADPNEHDTGPAAGSDVDLHFAHAYANQADIDGDGAPDPWFSNPFDAFWYNPHPNWADYGASADDPRLDLDDTDGAGPENMNLDLPDGTVQQPVAYDVGVHYWHDHGFGVSKATVRIWIDGELIAVLGPQPLNPFDMWHVARIWWPNKQIDPAATHTSVALCHQTNSGVGNKQGVAKTWSGTGPPCLTSCYINPAFTAAGSAANAATCN